MQPANELHRHEEQYHGFARGIALLAGLALVITLIVIAVIS